MRIVIAALLLAFVAAATGCGWRKQHLSRDYGQSYTAAFAVQRVASAKTAPASAVTGLDSQEAAIISDSYRSSLAPKGVKVTEEPVLMIAPQPRTPVKLAPSVPKEE